MKKIKFLALFLALAMTFTACANKPKGAVAKLARNMLQTRRLALTIPF